MDSNKDVASQVVQAVDSANAAQDNLIELSTGVVLRGKQAPPLILMTIMAHFPRPKPPLVFMESMGREMENPDNPDYLDQVNSWQTEQSSATVNALILSGTELVSKPNDMPGPNDAAWLDEYALLGMPMRADHASWRYLRWVQYKAAVSSDDIQKIMKVVGRLSGVPESAVQTAESFPRSDQEGRRRG